jgi:hypothetical protein
MAGMQGSDTAGFDVRFVDVEDGVWLTWLAERGGLIGLSGREDGAIESLYAGDGTPLRHAPVGLGKYWALEIDRPGLVGSLEAILAPERDRSPARGAVVRVMALFPVSFKREVVAAVRSSEISAGPEVLVAFTPSALRIVRAALQSPAR